VPASRSVLLASILAFVIAHPGLLPRRACAAAAPVSPPPTAPCADQRPVVLYTDLQSGPNSGGEGDNGAYLSIFGKNFGTGGLGTRVHVLIGGREVAGYRYLGTSRGRPDIQQITVQIGHLGNPQPGVALPIEVLARGMHSNTNVTFTVNPGRILYVDNVKGSDTWARVGDISRPFRHVQTPDGWGAWIKARPGDIIVMRGRGSPWTDLGYEHYFIRFADRSGSAPTGKRDTGPIALQGYPGEDVFIHGTQSGGMTGGCISAINGLTHPGQGRWVVIADLRLDCEGTDGPISEEIHGDDWRVVNNELSASTAPTSGPHAPRMAGITGNGSDSVWLGNHIHDVQGSFGEAHGIYIDGQGSYEIAYNLIERIRSGNGLQTFANGGNGSEVIDDVTFHHNMIRDVSKHGINIADGSRAGFLIYDNVVYGAAYAGIRINANTLSGAEIYNNTLYDTNTGSPRHNALYGILTNDWTLNKGALAIYNNILQPADGAPYLGGTVGFGPTGSVASSNIFHGGSGPTLGDGAVTEDPDFVNAANGDFHLRHGSPALRAGTLSFRPPPPTNYDACPAPRSTVDIGAY
jgi:hypothetical protein